MMTDSPPQSCDIYKNFALVNKLSEGFATKIEDFLTAFQIDFNKTGKGYRMACPIHPASDNENGVRLYTDTFKTQVGNFKCYTRNCHSVFGSSLASFVRGVLSNRLLGWSSEKDPQLSWRRTIDWMAEFINVNLNEIDISNLNIDKEKNQFISQYQLLELSDNTIDRKSYLNSVEIPSKYFIGRGFNKRVLEKYKVGDCLNRDKAFYGRAMIPIYDPTGKHIVGLTGRSLFEKCDICNTYHNSLDNCPINEKWKFSKWRHSTGLKTQKNLFNFWFAKEHIQAKSEAILVESPGNVLKLEQYGIHNSVGLLGTNLSEYQTSLLDSTGLSTLILALDNDDAGQKAQIKIEKDCKRFYRIKTINLGSYNDIAEMNRVDIVNLLGESYASANN